MVSLKPFNTFGVAVQAHAIYSINSEEALLETLSQLKDKTYFVLGGGSNLLFTKDYEGDILRICIPGIQCIESTDSYVRVEVGAGENWHSWVQYAVNQNWGGLENLSLIPGTVGAAPIQNIGAYGAEVKDTIESVRYFDLQEHCFKVLSKDECRFSYRDSCFKTDLKGRAIITRVVFRLNLAPHTLRLDYGSIREELSKRGIESPSLAEVSEVVCAIRRSKLPDPAILGNSGSFFKNPEVAQEIHAKLKNDYPEIPGYPTSSGLIKIPAAWLIEQAGWKGRRIGDTGTYERHALVLVNYGNATGPEVWAHAQRIITDVEARFGIRLEPEVNIIG